MTGLLLVNDFVVVKGRNPLCNDGHKNRSCDFEFFHFSGRVRSVTHRLDSRSREREIHNSVSVQRRTCRILHPSHYSPTPHRSSPVFRFSLSLFRESNDQPPPRQLGGPSLSRDVVTCPVPRDLIPVEVLCTVAGTESYDPKHPPVTESPGTRGVVVAGSVIMSTGKGS